jgi:hypothetical protein
LAGEPFYYPRLFYCSPIPTPTPTPTPIPTLGSPRIAQWAQPNVFLMRVCDAALWAPAAESRHCTLTARQPDEGQWPLNLFSHWCCRGPDDALHCLREFIYFLLQRPARELYCNASEASRGLTTLGRRLRLLGEIPVRSSTSGAGYQYSARGGQSYLRVS